MPAARRAAFGLPFNSISVARFSQANRLRGPDSFRGVLATAAFGRGRIVSVYAKPNERSLARLGIVIGRRVANRAVDRNYCKRRIRETFRVFQAELNGLDVVVRFGKSWDRRLKADLRGEIRELFLTLTQCRS